MKEKYLFLITLLCVCFASVAQDEDLLSMANDEPKPKEFVSATFKGTRLINLHTVEVPGKNSLEFRISHRFGDLNSGSYDFFGLDGGASIRLGLEYSPDGRFEFALGRSSLDKVYDGFLKYKLLRQTKEKGVPVTVTLFAGMYYATINDPNKSSSGYDKYEYRTSRLSYAYQIIIARKFSSSFSLQVSPTMVHYNLVDFKSDNNDLYAIGLLARYKFTKRVALTFEYAYRLNKYTSKKFYDGVGIGIDIETGGHVFQILLTNSAGMIEPQFIGQTSSDWMDMGLKIGFNISRMFTMSGRRK